MKREKGKRPSGGVWGKGEEIAGGLQPRPIKDLLKGGGFKPIWGKGKENFILALYNSIPFPFPLSPSLGNAALNIRNEGIRLSATLRVGGSLRFALTDIIYGRREPHSCRVEAT